MTEAVLLLVGALAAAVLIALGVLELEWRIRTRRARRQRRVTDIDLLGVRPS